MIRTATSTAKYVSLVVASIVMLLPLGLILFGSFKTGQEFLSTGPMTPPANWFNVENYVTAFTRGQHALGVRQHDRHLRGGDRRDDPDRCRHGVRARPFPLRRSHHVLVLFLLATLVPGVTTQVATFQIINGLGLYDSRFALILLFMGTDIISIYIFLQFIERSRVAGRGGDDRGRRAPADLLPDHPAQPQAGHRDRRHHQGHRDLQRVLPAVPLPAVERTSRRSPPPCSPSRAPTARSGRSSRPAWSSRSSRSWCCSCSWSGTSTTASHEFARAAASSTFRYDLGAEKCATRWLRFNLGLHPDVFAASTELSFFNNGPRYNDLGVPWYRKQFEGWSGVPVVGEATPGYMFWRHRPYICCERIREVVPDARPIAIPSTPLPPAWSAK